MNDVSVRTAPALPAARRWTGRYAWLLFIMGGGLLLIWLWLGDQSGLIGPIISVDVEQPRSNVMLPLPRGGVRIRQSFYAHWDGLSEVELLAARTEEPDAEESGQLRLQLVDDANTVVAETFLANSSVSHNQVIPFRFPVQAHSAGRRYHVLLTGNGSNELSVWGYSMDLLAEGRLTVSGSALEPAGPDTNAMELRFTTRYHLTGRDALIALTTALTREGPLLLLSLFLIPLPGVILLLLPKIKTRRWDPAAWWGAAFALGTAAWPLLWFAITLVGGRLRGGHLWIFLALGWSAAIALLIRQRRAEEGLRLRPQQTDTEASLPRQLIRSFIAPLKWHHGLLLALLLLAVAARFLAIRDLAFPAWVDSSRHALITSIMAEEGQFLSQYAPLLPVDRSPYHYGFHTLPASLALMTGWPINRLLLSLGQLLNGLLPLSLYAAVWLLTRRRGEALLAAFLVGLPFFFPAYYTTWGRYTQLTAMFLMPILLALSWLLIRGGRRQRRLWWLVGIAAAGLFLVHFRVFLFYIPFVLIVWLISFGRNGRRLAAAGGLALALISPRIVQLLGSTAPLERLGYSIPNYNRFPLSYVNIGWEREFIALAIPGLLLTMFYGFKRRRWTTLPLLLTVWVALLFLLLAGESVGLPETSLVNLNSMYITLFLPLSIFLSITATQAWLWFKRSHWLFEMIGLGIAGAAITAALLFGFRQQITILNSQTILAKPGDLAALDWLKRQLPDDAVIAVNSWRWLGNTWAGSDGGAWMLPLTGRAATTPPVDYIYGEDLRDTVTSFNSAAADIPDWSTSEAAGWLREQTVTHVFIGVQGGQFEPATLSRNPEMEMVYGRDGAFIFALTPGK